VRPPRLARCLVTLAQAAAGAVVLARLAAGRRRAPRLRPQALPPAEVGASVSVVVPARDEAGRIGPCLDALMADTQVREVVVVDDESSDATAEVAARAGARVVPGRPLPPGWVGKQWALWQGVSAATGTWVVTLDADARPEPGLAGALLAAAAEHGLDLVTVGPRFACDTPGERLLHPSMLATLVYRFGPPGVGAGSPERVVANGQCMAFRRELLADGQAFAAVKGNLTDDVALARWLAGRGRVVGFMDGAELLTVRMHTSAAETWREWGRSLALADVTGPAWQAADLAVVWLTMGLPPLRLATGRGTPLDLGLLALRFALAGALAGSYTRPRGLVWLSPLADPASAARLTLSALRPARTWRGRTYERPTTPARTSAR
jgi:dolichol-phosphate mannosyltransferase